MWSYPALGLQAVLWDRALDGHYGLPAAERADPDPRPNLAAIAAHPELVAVGGGRGVFSALPPGRHARPLDVLLTRYPAPGGVRVVASIATPGSPADTLQARFVILDQARHDVTREHALLGVSVCDPLGSRAVEFASDLAPGDYRAAFAVEDAHGGRGVVTRPLHVDPPPPGLAISDLVPVCGDLSTRLVDRTVRIEPRTGPVPPGGALDVYFEVAGLRADSSGASRLRLTGRVRARPAVGHEAPRNAEIETSREDTQPGALRREFLHVPLAGLGPGAWNLEVEVRDLATGAIVSTSVDFETGAPAAVTSAKP